MSPAASLLLTLIGLHFVEGLFWVRRRATAFARGWRGARRVRTEGPFGTQTHTFLLLSPFPPLFDLFVVERWPLTFEPDRAWNVPFDEAGTSSGELALDAGAVRDARAEGKAVYAQDASFVSTSSAALASQLASLLRSWAAAAPKKRADIVRAALRSSFDRESIRARLELFEHSTRRLRVYCNLIPFAMLGSVYAFFFPFVLPSWVHGGPLWLIGIFGVLLLLTWIETYIVHRGLYPDLRGDRWFKLALLVLSFPAAARARGWLGRDLFAGFHPLAVGQVLLPREQFEKYASEQWRALLHPLSMEPGRREGLAAIRAELLAAYAELLRSAGLDPTAIDLPPPHLDARARAYCPRCHGEYLDAEGDCSECPGVARRTWSPA